MRGGVGKSTVDYDHIKEIFRDCETGLDRGKTKHDILREQQRYAEELRAQMQQNMELKRLAREGATVTLQNTRLSKNEDNELCNNGHSSTLPSLPIPPGAALRGPTNPPSALPTAQVQSYDILINESELRKQLFADSMASDPPGPILGTGQYGGGSGPLKDPAGNIITDLNAVKQYPEKLPDVYNNIPRRLSVSVQDKEPPNTLSQAWNANADSKEIERQKQQIAFRAALDEQIADKKRRKQEELHLKKREAEEEEARLALERQKLREQFESDHTAKKKAAGASDKSAAETMEGDGVVIKFKKPPPTKTLLDDSTPSSTKRPKPINASSSHSAEHESIDKTSNPGGRNRRNSRGDTALSSVENSTENHHQQCSNLEKQSSSFSPSDDPTALDDKELQAVKTALQQQLEEIRKLKTDAFESERRSIQVIKDLLDLTRGQLVNTSSSTSNSGVQPPITAIAAQPTTMFVMPAQSFQQPNVIYSAAPANTTTTAVLPPARLPILVTTATLRLDDSRPSTSQSALPGSVPVLHTMSSRLRTTATIQEDSFNTTKDTLDSEQATSPRIAAIKVNAGLNHRSKKHANDDGLGATKSDSKMNKATRLKGSSAESEAPRTRTATKANRNGVHGTDQKRDVDIPASNTATNQQLSSKSRWRGSKLWPFGPGAAQKTGEVGLWAWEGDAKISN